MKQNTMSLIISAYNEEKYIGDCLEHVIKNSRGVFDEIIVVDNASSDRTSEIAASYEGVKVVREDKKGLTRARQRGFEEAKGDILVYIDADTRVPKGWHEKILKEFSLDKNLACLSGPGFYYDMPKHHKIFANIYWYAIAMPTYWISGYMVYGAHFAIKKDIIKKIGGFDTSIEFYGEDTNIARRAHAHGKVKFTPTFYIYTSGRRLKDQGIYKTGLLYIANYLSEVFYKKPATREYNDYR